MDCPAIVVIAAWCIVAYLGVSVVCAIINGIIKGVEVDIDKIRRGKNN